MSSIQKKRLNATRENINVQTKIAASQAKFASVNLSQVKDILTCSNRNVVIGSN